MNSNQAVSKVQAYGWRIEHRGKDIGEGYEVIVLPKGELTGLKKLRVLDYLRFLGYYIERN